MVKLHRKDPSALGRFTPGTNGLGEPFPPKPPGSNLYDRTPRPYGDSLAMPSRDDRNKWHRNISPGSYVAVEWQSGYMEPFQGLPMVSVDTTNLGVTFIFHWDHVGYIAPISNGNITVVGHIESEIPPEFSEGSVPLSLGFAIADGDQTVIRVPENGSFSVTQPITQAEIDGINLYPDIPQPGGSISTWPNWIHYTVTRVQLDLF